MSVFKWIMDSGATKHITLHRTTFNVYEVICLRNVHLGNDRVAKTIGMWFIINVIETRGKANIFHLMDVLHMLKLQTNLLLVSKFLSNMLKM